MNRTTMIVLLAGLVACGGSADPSDSTAPDGTGSDADGAVVLAKADGWREGLQEAAGHPYALVEIATGPDVAKRAWEENVPDGLPMEKGDPDAPGIYGDMASVDFDRQALVVFSSGQSGTCPAWVQDIDAVDDRVEVDLDTVDAPACTDDFQTYRMLLAVDRRQLPPADQLPVERVDLPSENLTDVEGRVVGYPVG